MAIAPMTRVFVVGPSDRKEEAVRFLQGVGLLHVEPVARAAPDDEKKNAAVLARLRKIDQLRKVLDRFRGTADAGFNPAPGTDLVACADEQWTALQEIQTRRQALQRLAADLADWGDFGIRQIRALEEQGVYIRRFRMDANRWESFAVPDGMVVEVVSRRQGVFFYAITTDRPAEIPQASVLPWPDLRLSEVEAQLETLREEERKRTGALGALAAQDAQWRRIYGEALTEAHYTEQMTTLYAEPYLFGMQGWVPTEREGELLRQIEKGNVPLQVSIRPPEADETPPVLLKNNWFVRRIEPLLRLYGLPNYREIDVSYFFAPFMIAFFGICLGDAGYGLAMFGLCHFLEKKLGPKTDGLVPVMRLCKAFAVAAILFGILTGSVFGYNFENRSWILLDVSVGPGDPMLFFYLSLAIGVVHLSTSYLLGMAQAATRLERMQKLGLLFVLWGGALLVVRAVWFGSSAAALHMPLQYAGSGALGLGLLLTLLFASDHRNWAFRIGLGLWNVYGLTGLIGDLLSYARLFGLGIATSAIASVMNQLAKMVLDATGPVGIVFAVLVVLLGHTFNLLLSILGSTVHSARLHFVEAFKSFFQGGGAAYRPFRIEKGS